MQDLFGVKVQDKFLVYNKIMAIKQVCIEISRFPDWRYGHDMANTWSRMFWWFFIRSRIQRTSSYSLFLSSTFPLLNKTKYFGLRLYYEVSWERSEQERWRLRPLDNLSPWRVNRQTDGHCDSLSPWRSQKEGLFWIILRIQQKFWFTLHVLVTFPCGAAWLGGLCLLRPSLLSLPPQTINPSLLTHITALLPPDLVKATTVFWFRSKENKCVYFCLVSFLVS